VSLFTDAKPRTELTGLTYFTQPRERRRLSARSWALASVVLVLCGLLNWLLR
jgi:hypothetical protein